MIKFNSKHIILCFLMVFSVLLMTVSSVCAEDADNTTIQVTEQIAPVNEVIGEDLIVNNINATGSFNELQLLINNNEIVNLTKDYAAMNSEGSILITSNKTINGNGHTLNGNAITKIFEIEGGNIVFNDITFINGKNYVDDGGAICVFNADSLTFNNITFENNQARGYGGAVFISNCNSVSFLNCDFLKNNAYNGGAIYTTGSLDIIDCLFNYNEAKYYGGAINAENVIVISSNFRSNGALSAGAIFSKNMVDIVDSLFKFNLVDVDGGAIYSVNNVSVKNSTFDSNVASGDMMFVQCCVGAISSANDVKVDNSIFLNNHAGDYGGAIYADTVTWMESLSYFVGNYAEDNQGGAIYTNKFNTDVKYGIFIGNQAKDDDGGAIYINKENHITFSHCTFKDNYAADEGGAIYLDSSSSDLTLKDYNSFINNHAGDEGQAVFNKGTYGEIKNNWWGTDSPDFSNDLLVEWKAIWSNVKHGDSSPLTKHS